MKKVLLIGLLLLIFGISYAIEPETPYLGDTFIPRNVTVSSYTTTAIISTTEAPKMGDWVIQNNGSYNIFISTYSGADTAGLTVGKLLAGQSISLGGRVPKAIYAVTEKGTSNTSRLDVFLIYKD